MLTTFQGKRPEKRTLSGKIEVILRSLLSIFDPQLAAKKDPCKERENKWDRQAEFEHLTDNSIELSVKRQRADMQEGKISAMPSSAEWTRMKPGVIGDHHYTNRLTWMSDTETCCARLNLQWRTLPKWNGR